ncbi:MAG: hypothetical protein JWL77_3327 [Chthonomonadaceae bacterium]|nr:hypothetical protein [Chthonomonadaceae bacterium]
MSKPVFRLLYLLVLAFSLYGLPSAAQGLGPSNLIIASTNLNSNDPTKTSMMYEFTRGGSLVKKMPVPDGTGTAQQFLRGMTVDSQDRLFFYDGTFSPNLSTYDSRHGTWTQPTVAGWSMVNNINYGGIATYGNYVFLPDMATAYDGSPNGIIRYNPNDGSYARFSSGVDFIDATMGNDGLLYVRAYDDGYGTPFYVFDPNSMAVLRVFHTSGVNSIVVTREGEIIGISGTRLVHMHSDGTVVNAIATGHNPYNIAISSDRKVAVSCADGWIILTDETLTNVTGFQALTHPDYETWIVWVAFVPNAGALHHTQDFSGDGKADLLFQNKNDGSLACWFADGQNVIGSAPINLGVAAGYRAVGIEDFNGDGSPDIVFQNATTGQIVIWYMSGTTFLGGASVSPYPAAGDKVVGVGDFDGDGSPDIVLQNQTTGRITLWYMSGTTVLRTAAVTAVPTAGYKVVGAGDFDGDGHRDLVFQNASTGQVVVWYMNSNTLLGGAVVPYLPGSQWQVKNVADFDGDGKPDIAFQNQTTGQIVLWYMNNVTVNGGGQTTLTPLSAYTIAGPQ